MYHMFHFIWMFVNYCSSRFSLQSQTSGESFQTHRRAPSLGNDNILPSGMHSTASSASMTEGYLSFVICAGLLFVVTYDQMAT